jgi:YegS/Rv2252/BmrU family lipid kinase
LFNPEANFGRAQKLREVLKRISEGEGDSDWQETLRPGHARDLAYQASQEYSRIIAIGGDGTAHEVANGLMQVDSAQRPELGVVPIGSGNDFSISAGIRKQPEQAFMHALRSSAQPIDLGKVEMGKGLIRYWINVLGIGFDAKVDIYSKRLRHLHGFWVYFMAALQTILLNHIPYHLSGKINGQEWKRDLLMLILSNGKQEGGGFKIAPRAKLSDGQLEYIAVKDISRLKMLLSIPFFLLGTHHQLPHVETRQVTKMQIESDQPLCIHADGEVLAGFDSHIDQLSLQVIHHALRVVI